MTLYRNVASLILAVMLLQGASGILSVTTPLAISFMGASALGVGLVAATFSTGFMLGAWFAPDIVRQVGHIRAYSAAGAIYASGILALALAFNPTGWAVLRFAQGFASAIMFASAESWMATSTPRTSRGSVLGLYQFLSKVALSCGPLLAVDHAPQDTKPFIWAGMLMVLAIVPLCATRRAPPVLPDKRALNLKSVMAIPPAALVGAIAAGLANQGVLSQLPLYAKELQPGSAQAAAAAISIAAWMGGTVTQWPAGLLSDKVDRRLVVVALGTVACGASVALFLTSGHVSWGVTVALAAMWGAGALSFYSVSASHATDRSEPEKIAAVMSGMLFVWAGASVLGPIVCGIVADTPLGQPGVFGVMAGVYLVLVLANLWRLALRRGPDPRMPFHTVPQTSVVVAEVAAEVAAEAKAPAPGV
jgi:MFS family permease